MSIGASRRKQPSSGRQFSMLWVRHLQQSIASLGELWRAPTSSLLTIAVIGACLALPVVFHLVIKNVQVAIPSWQESAQISLYLELDTQSQQRDVLVTSLESLTQVARVEVILKDQGLDDFKHYSGFGEALTLLGSNPLPDVLIITPSSTELAEVEMLRTKLAQMDSVAQVKLDMAWLERLSGILTMVQQSLALIIVLLIVSVLLTVGNTIRLNILNRREEIEILKLVGATNAFIQRPFLYTGFWFGFIGGLLAWLLSNIMMLWLELALEPLTTATGVEPYLQGLSLGEFGFLILLASGLGLLASGASVARHIREIEPS